MKIMFIQTTTDDNTRSTIIDDWFKAIKRFGSNEFDYFVLFKWNLLRYTNLLVVCFYSAATRIFLLIMRLFTTSHFL